MLQIVFSSFKVWFFISFCFCLVIMYFYAYSLRFLKEACILVASTTSAKKQKFYVLPTMTLCVLRGTQNKQRLFLSTALTYRFL
jgi:hypothetical protein